MTPMRRSRLRLSRLPPHTPRGPVVPPADAESCLHNRAVGSPRPALRRKRKGYAKPYPYQVIRLQPFVLTYLRESRRPGPGGGEGGRKAGREPQIGVRIVAVPRRLTGTHPRPGRCEYSVVPCLPGAVITVPGTVAHACTGHCSGLARAAESPLSPSSESPSASVR
jgi:hypothetical protein